MAIFYFQAGKTFANTDQIRVTVLSPIGTTGNASTYNVGDGYTRSPAWSGFEVEMTGRYLHAGQTAWERIPGTGV